MARPTEYKESFVDAVSEYLDIYENLGDAVPSVAGFACFIKVAKSSIYLWAADYPMFSDALDLIATKQEQKTLNGSLTGDLNPTISKLILHNHGYSDKAETQLTGAKGGPIQVEPITFVGVNKDSD